MSHFRHGRAVRNYVETSGMSVLTNEQIRAVAPSVFATEPHGSRSTRYAYVPTIDMLDGLRDNGFLPVKATQAVSRIEGKSEFTKHMLRLRHRDYLAGASSLAAPEVILINSHDGTSRAIMFAGMNVFACMNGLITATSEIGSFKVSHTGDALGEVIEGSYTVLDESLSAMGRAETWQRITLNRDEQMAFADAAHTLRFGEEATPLGEAIPAERLLTVRHATQSVPNLWNTWNVIQENTVRGGLTGQSRDANGARRRRTTRDVAGIDGDVKLNVALSRLAARMAEIKGA